ncbi:hypothetical protein Prudu_013306, partial [Prunus dulcis]
SLSPRADLPPSPPLLLLQLVTPATDHGCGRGRYQNDWEDVIFRPRTFPAGDMTCAGRKSLRNRRCSPDLQVARSPSILLQICRASGTRQTCRRDLQEAVACTRHPPPGPLDFRAFWFKSVGMGDSAEFSAGGKVEISIRTAIRSIVPTFAKCQTCTGFDSNSKAEFDSGPVIDNYPFYIGF